MIIFNTISDEALAVLPGTALRRRIERFQENLSAIDKKFIAAGRGQEKGYEIREKAKADPGDILAVQYVKHLDEFSRLLTEEAARKRWSGTMKPIKRSL